MDLVGMGIPDGEVKVSLLTDISYWGSQISIFFLNTNVLMKCFVVLDRCVNTPIYIS